MTKRSLTFSPFPVLLVNCATEAYENVVIEGRRPSNVAVKPNYRSQPEARKLLEFIRICDRMKRNVLALTPYREQLKEIKLQADKSGQFLSVDDSERIITVDQSQGMEADYVIISLTNSRPTKFLDSHRLNVMLSRARCGVVMLADLNVLRNYCEDPANKKRLALVSDFLAIGTERLDEAGWVPDSV